MATVYDATLAEIIEKHHWSFARKRRALSPLADPGLPQGWSFAYTLPTDMARFMYIEGQHIRAGDYSYWQDSYRTTHCIGADHEIMGTTIFANVADAYAVYTRKEVNTALFPASVVNAFAELLAAKLTMPIKGDERRYMAIMESAERVINEAIAADLNNQDMAISGTSIFEKARH